MLVYVKYDAINNKVLKSLTQLDSSWTQINIESLSDEIVYNSTTNTFDIVSAKGKLLEHLKSALKIITREYIYKYYPPDKQDSDLADKEAFSRWLNDVRTDLTLDDIDSTIYRDAYNIVFGIKTYSEVISLYPTTPHKYFDTTLPENVAWIQLLKTSLRVSWVQQIKLILTNTLNSLDTLTIDQLKNFNIKSVIDSYPQPPEYLL